MSKKTLKVFFSQSQILSNNFPVIFRGTGHRKVDPRTLHRSQQYNESTRSGAWYVFLYSLVDYDISKIPYVLKATVGSIFQFQTYRVLREEFESDCEQIIYKSQK